MSGRDEAAGPANADDPGDDHRRRARSMAADAADRRVPGTAGRHDVDVPPAAGALADATPVSDLAGAADLSDPDGSADIHDAAARAELRALVLMDREQAAQRRRSRRVGLRLPSSLPPPSPADRPS